ncbi:uncharacterized protein N7469_006097 [Penicillium citrinum]|uniref:monoamine oxidase n=1 Tax=Penicillium citrinum TaxID=5077 RepID=A0A9W9NXC8_PENCI|nr:uncharacterized protein N7469_006097 [Penicillium citrinum]KAJ5231509.1 hypothetical protein N7469_006097 [Penicillium citrinum]
MFDLVVIGTGFSGVQAAHTAKQAGLSVSVLEARDCVGGKIWSVPLAPGRGFAELGGAWVNDSLQPRVWSYAQKFGLKVVKQCLEGTAIMQPSENERFEFPFGTTPESLKNGLLSAEVDKVTLDQYVHSLGALPKFAKMVNMWSQVMHGLESTEESAAWFIDYCRRGAQSITREIARLVEKDNIHVSCPIKAINDYDSHVTIKTRNGMIFSAKKCILSVPSTMYKAFSFSPALPSAVQEVTNNTVLGDYNKAIVCHDKPWFNGYFASYSGPITLARDTRVVEKDHYSLTCFVNDLHGRKWENLPSHERRAAALKQLTKGFKNHPDVFKQIEYFDQIWQHEEFSRGALASIHALGHLTKYALVYGQPVGNIHFVGTEYSSEWKGYMEGALCSGEHGAKQVAGVLQNPTAKI